VSINKSIRISLLHNDVKRVRNSNADSVVLSAVQTVLCMIPFILPPIVIIRIFPVSCVIRRCLSECLGVINFAEVRF
jgi:hypothetical protein